MSDARLALRLTVVASKSTTLELCGFVSHKVMRC